ncbi:MAG: enolase C-terminal domain-like protein [Anaerolineae bacterium]
MKITKVRLLQLEGVLEHEGEFWEERLARPIDLYPAHRANPARETVSLGEGRQAVRSIFVIVETDAGLSGMGGPINDVQALIIARQFTPLLLGQDPRATELLWDQMYRLAVHGRKGVEMMAISAVDCALWDVKGKWAGAPVYRLLGGPTRDAIPAYASALGYSLAPELVRQRAQDIVAQGYRATKWFFRATPAEGREGMARNLQLAETLREAVGPDVDIMFDCWMSWDVPYTLAMAERLAEYRPRWLEEPLQPDRIAECAEIRRRSPIPIATGEHEYTRWGLKALLDAGAADVLQPDIYWAGGITEMVKICAIASTYDIPVIPHGHSTPASLHLIAAQPPNVCPWLEYLIKWNQIHQFFFKAPIQPVNGMVTLPDAPGMGVALDETKIQRQRELGDL